MKGGISTLGGGEGESRCGGCGLDGGAGTLESESESSCESSEVEEETDEEDPSSSLSFDLAGFRIATVFFGVDTSDEEEESSSEEDESDTTLLFRFLFRFLVGCGAFAFGPGMVKALIIM